MALLAVFLGLPLDGMAQELSFDLDDASPPPKAEPAPLVNHLSLGLRVQSGNSASYSRTQWRSDQSPVLLGEWFLQDRGDWSAKNRDYLQFRGDGVDFASGKSLPDSSIGLRTGQQGLWGVKAAYDAMTYTQSLGFSSPYDPSGQLAPGISAYGGSGKQVANSTYAATTLGPRLLRHQAQTQRQAGDVSLHYVFQDWTLTSGLRHERKVGTLEQSMSLGAVVTFPQPVDYDSDRFDLSLAYGGERAQATLAYSFSNFTDNKTVFSAQDVYYYTATGNAIHNLQANYSLPPSNQAHQVTGQLAISPDATTRINATLSYGVQLQDEPFVSASGTSGLTLGGGSLPSSLHAAAQTYFGQLSYSSQPWRKTDFKTSYTVDGRDAGVDRYGAVVGTSNDYSTWMRGTIPQSWIKHTAKAEMGYRLRPGTRVFAGYSYNNTERNYALVSRNQEHTASTGVNSRLANGLNAALSYDHGERSGYAVPLNSFFTDVMNIVPRTTTYGVAYYQAARQSDTVKGRLSLGGLGDATLGLAGKYRQNTYLKQVNGVMRDEALSLGPDVGFALGQDLTLHSYYMFERSYRTLRQQVTASTAWTHSETDDVHSLGSGLDWKLNDRIHLGADYTISYGRATTALFDGILGTPSTLAGIEQLPDVTSQIQSLRVHGDYAVLPNLCLSLVLGIDRLRMTDWAQGWSATQTTDSTGSLLGGDTRSNHTIGTILTKATLSW